MRISDWSSDVCSSDLWIMQRNVYGSSTVLAPKRRVNKSVVPTFAPSTPELSKSLVLVTARTARGQRRQIGRASCRDRVCQYAYISVVAASFKKITKEITNELIRHHTI